jgi:hypothetical protein
MIFLRRLIILLLCSISLLESGDRKVLLEMFTNAHCYSCVAAYELFRQFRVTNPNSSNVSYVLYHVTQPGVEDSIYYENRSESDQRNAYYGSHNAAPLLFIDGTFTGSNTKTWEQYIAARVPVASPLSISVKGKESGNSVTVETTVLRNGAVPDNDLRLFVVLTESVSSYVGKNGVTPQIYAMRKMLSGASGEPFSLSEGSSRSVTHTVELKPHWDREKLWVTVFIQSASKRTVYQSAMVSTTFFPVSAVPSASVPEMFSLEQNFPNPFNPSTTILFSLPSRQFVSLSAVDLLGNEVVSILREERSAGSHSLSFEASHLPSGLYFLRLQAGGRTAVRKMLLLR